MKAGVASPGVLRRTGWSGDDIRRRLLAAYTEHKATMRAHREAERKAKK